MGMKRTVMAGGLALALVVGGSACSKVAEKVAEKASGCEDIDASGDEVGAECDGVSSKVDSDGNASVTDEDGNSFDVSADGTGELPEGWPADLAPPEGTRIISSNVSNGNFSVTAGIDGDVTAAYEGIKSQLDRAGYTLEADTVTSAGIGDVASVTASGPGFDASVSVSENQAQPEYGTVLVNWVLTEATG